MNMQFTSSQIYKLMTKGRGAWSIENLGAPFYTYIKEVKRELLIGRKINITTSNKYCDWGNVCEGFFYEKYLKKDFELVSKKRYKKTDYWSGSPDLINNDTVGDIKCPFTLNGYLDLYELNSGEELKECKPEYYWQLVSNSILTGLNKAILIVFTPKLEELKKIRVLSETTNIGNFGFMSDDELPYIESEKIENIKKIYFEVPEDEKDNLIKRVEKASNFLYL